jgi:hypothetical protein
MGYLIGFGFGLLWLIVKLAYKSRPRRKRERGFPFIYVEEDGSARELSTDEQKYLNTEFEFGDGGRPYIKSIYETLTPDGKISGYLSRRQLPQDISVKPMPE